MPFSQKSNLLTKILNLLINLIIIILLLSPPLKTEETIKKNTKILNLKNIESTIKTMFWLSVEINSVEFRKGCLSTALCHRPTFKLSQTMTLNGQTVMMSWPMEGGAETLLQANFKNLKFGCF